MCTMKYNCNQGFDKSRMNLPTATTSSQKPEPESILVIDTDSDDEFANQTWSQDHGRVKLEFEPGTAQGDDSCSGDGDPDADVAGVPLHKQLDIASEASEADVPTTRPTKRLCTHEETSNLDMSDGHYLQEVEKEVEVEVVVEKPTSSNEGAEAAKAAKSTKSMVGGRHKVHSSPDFLLIPISPAPACIISLNANDHRWRAKWKNQAFA